ncbi:hypothetical protein HO625_00775 [Streptococcus suis]|nr:hypothetical protein [Streptococcus suis]
MSTSATNTENKRTIRTFITYLALTSFLFIFSRVYESLSYGETAFHMHYLFCVTLIGGSLLLGLMTIHRTLSRLTYNLWNSGVAVITAGFLLRGIINLSGRSTTLDQPYWYVGAGFLILAVISLFIKQIKTAAPTV